MTFQVRFEFLVFKLCFELNLLAKAEFSCPNINGLGLIFVPSKEVLHIEGFTNEIEKILNERTRKEQY